MFLTQYSITPASKTTMFHNLGFVDVTQRQDSPGSKD